MQCKKELSEIIALLYYHYNFYFSLHSCVESTTMHMHILIVYYYICVVCNSFFHVVCDVFTVIILFLSSFLGQFLL